jgi:flagellar biosynthesis regulator FlbT
MLVRKSLKKLMGVFKDFSVCLKNKKVAEAEMER